MDDNGPLDLTDEPDDGYFERIETEETTHTETFVTKRTIRIQSNRLQPGDWEGLVKALRQKLTLDEEEIAELREAVEADEHEDDRDERGIGRRTRDWLGKMAVKITTGAVTGVTVDVLTRLVLIYLGVPTP
jgi:hypothetical protein